MKNQSGTFLHSALGTCLIFIFTTKTTGFSRFRISDFSSQLASCVACRFVCERVRESRDELVKRKKGHPPNRVGGYMCIDSISLFFWKINCHKNTTHWLAIYIFFSIKKCRVCTTTLVIN